MGGSATKLKNVKNENPITLWQIQSDLGSGSYDWRAFAAAVALTPRSA
jgi:hypothetical protein